jgi:superfamily II DNA helicase RecQ
MMMTPSTEMIVEECRKQPVSLGNAQRDSKKTPCLMMTPPVEMIVEESMKQMPVSLVKAQRGSKKKVEFVGLESVLREWRKATALALGRPAFSVLTDKSIAAILQDRPQTLDAFIACPGIGPAKCVQFGVDIIEMCRVHKGL